MRLVRRILGSLGLTLAVLVATPGLAHAGSGVWTWRDSESEWRTQPGVGRHYDVDMPVQLLIATSYSCIATAYLKSDGTSPVDIEMHVYAGRGYGGTLAAKTERFGTGWRKMTIGPWYNQSGTDHILLEIIGPRVGSAAGMTGKDVRVNCQWDTIT